MTATTRSLAALKRLGLLQNRMNIAQFAFYLLSSLASSRLISDLALNLQSKSSLPGLLSLGLC